MNDQELVLNIVKYVGGKENIKTVTNCMTRLRFELKDGSLFNVEGIKSLDGVLSVVHDRLEYPEIVLGPGRCRKCADICREQGLYSKDNDKASVDDNWESNKSKIKNSQNDNMIKNILKSFGEVFVPLIPGVIVAGICAGVAMLITQCIPDYKNNTFLAITYQVLSLINVSFMTYINAWVGYRVAEKFGATPILGGMLGMITNLDGINEISKIIGLWDENAPLASILRAGKGGILAVFIGVIILAKVEKWIRKHMPENLDTIGSPLITILLCSTIHMIVIMPIMGFVSTLICDVVEMGCMSNNPIVRVIIGYISSLIFLPLVSMGMHHGLIAIYSVQLEKLGFVTLYPSLAMAGAGQVGAAIAIYMIAKKVKNNQICKVINGALPAGILGIGEPLIYGVTLPLGKPFITAGLGAGFGGAFMMLKQVAATTWGPSGILALFIMTAGPNTAVMSMIYYVIGLIISTVMGFLFTKFLFSEKDFNTEIDIKNIATKEDKDIISNINSFNVNNNKPMKVLKGKSVTNGIVIAKVSLWQSVQNVEEKHVTNIDDEINRFDKAYNEVLLEMEKTKNNVDEKAAEIIEARKMMLEDKSFIDAIKNKIKESFAAEYAAFVVGNEKAKEMEKMDNEYLRARSTDIHDIANKLINVLCGDGSRKSLDTPSIVFAEEVTPEEISSANTNKVLAFVTRKGSAASHASIIASNMGIPYVFSVNYDEKEIQGADFAIVDADNATIILDPDEKTFAEYKEKKEKEEKVKENNKILSKDIDEELKKCGIAVYANIAGPDDVDMVLENGAGGIGLYRTEFLYMKADKVPTEDEQYEAYKNVLVKMGDKEVIIRTMDIGADKEAKCLNLPHEENPALGKRAIRICLDDVELFRTQLRALLRAAVYGHEKIMFPMIACAKEIDDIKEQIKIAEEELKEKNISYKVPPIGIMIETPAAAIMSSELAKRVDFFSIGTNDLTQYTLAVDRTGKNLDRFYRADDEAVLRLIKMTVDGAKTAGIPVGICGEIAGNVDIIPKLIEIGVNEFSMAPTKILKVKQKVSEIIKLKDNKSKKDSVEDLVEELFAPADGDIVSMKDIPDKAFSSGGLGNCIGINPENGNVYAPCDGVITSIAETKHAIGIKSKNGKEILIHVGIDTVTLKGQGFELYVKDGDSIKKGDLLLKCDVDYIKNKGLSPMVIMAITKE